ncbi:MAG: trehalose-6-phosphate synthase, partial [Kiloniellales bacterium]|nr:trehalose-6-phosphate synthase [Kiloniellales bacterium]
EDPGVLVLSRFAGAAERLTGALLVNPFDVDGMAAAMGRALDMPRDERHARWSEMIVELRAHDVHAWREDFLRSLFEARRDRPTSRHLESGLGAPRRPAFRSDGAQGSRDRIIESRWDLALASGDGERGAERRTACAGAP